MSEVSACLLIVTAEVDAAMEAEWNRWYDPVPLPDALSCPGVRRGRRYVSTGEISESLAGKTERTARRIYTTIYELDSPDAVATPERRAMRGWYHFAPHVRSRTQVIVPVQSRSRCRRVFFGIFNTRETSGRPGCNHRMSRECSTIRWHKSSCSPVFRPGWHTLDPMDFRARSRSVSTGTAFSSCCARFPTRPRCRH